jgi:hypothetical protein
MPHLDLDAFEYAMGLFSVVIGLAVTDVATSFHRLMRSRRDVRWDSLTLAAAVYTLCMAVYMWFDIWGVRRIEATRHFFFYLALVAQLFVLFLAAAASLPDDAPEQLDLKAYYAGNRAYFWWLMALFQTGYTAFGVYFVGDDWLRLAPPRAFLPAALMTAPALVCIVLALVRSRPAHYAGVALLFLLMAAHYGAAQIG